jgi:hypothetical protein
VTAAVTLAPVAHVGSPKFTVCPSATGASCSLGTVPVGQTDELQASVKVGSRAARGEDVTLTGRATNASAASDRSSATVTVTGKNDKTPAPAPSTRAIGGGTGPATTTVPPASTTLPPVTLPAVPQPGTSATDPSGLFPTVSPTSPGLSTSPSPRSSLSFPTVTGPSRHGGTRVRAATTAATLPLDPRLIGGQLAGLAVLAGAIAMAITRLSLRTQRPQDGTKKSE